MESVSRGWQSAWTCRRRRLKLPYALVLSLCLFIPASGHARAIFGSIELHDNPTEKGLEVVVSDVKITGYEDRLVTFAFSITDAGGEKIVIEYYQFQETRETATWDRLVFDFSEQSLQTRFGEGEHDLYLVFTAAVVENGESNLIPDGYYARPVRVAVKPADASIGTGLESLADLTALSPLEPVFKRAIEVGKIDGINFIVRNYAPASDTIRRQYSWRNLEESDNDNLIRTLFTVLSCLEELPPAFVSTTALRSVAFVGDVSFLGLDVGAGFDVNDRTVIIEVNDYFEDEHLRNAFFHEYMHLIDNSFARKGYFGNEKWAALNPRGSAYRQAGALNMIQDDPDYRKVLRWMRDDPFLKAKFDFMIDELGRIHPALTKEYFDNLHR